MKEGRAAVKKGNIFSYPPVGSSQEVIEELLKGANLRIERIVSRGHKTPEGSYYDQVHNEWVMVLKGKAIVRVFGKRNSAEGTATSGEYMDVELGPGDYLFIPSHVIHRVEWTDPEQDTLWLALHFDD